MTIEEAWRAYDSHLRDEDEVPDRWFSPNRSYWFERRDLDAAVLVLCRAVVSCIKEDLDGLWLNAFETDTRKCRPLDDANACILAVVAELDALVKGEG